jgi:hypothetical protein
VQYRRLDHLGHVAAVKRRARVAAVHPFQSVGGFECRADARVGGSGTRPPRRSSATA